MPSKTRNASSAVFAHGRTSSAGILPEMQHNRQDHLRKERMPVRIHSNPSIAHNRVVPRDNLPAVSKRSRGTNYQRQNPPPPPNKKQKAAFTIAADYSGSPQDDDDDSEWVSSESGAVTPDHQVHSSPDPSPDVLSMPIDVQLSQLRPDQSRGALADKRPDISQRTSSDRSSTDPALFGTPVPRPETPRFSIRDLPVEAIALPSPAPSPAPAPPAQIHEPKPPKPRPASEVRRPAPPPQDAAPKRYSSAARPPSVHSVFSRTEAPLRPHPLIRGQSFGQPAMNYTIKPSPLAPTTVTSETVSRSPVISTILDENLRAETSAISASPTSTSPTSPRITLPSFKRRTSISSARSVSTVPIQPSTTSLFPSSASATSAAAKAAVDRSRTLSTLSTSTSSAALQSLAAMQNVQLQGPHSHAASIVQQQLRFMSRFPAHMGYGPPEEMEKIHPLLPSPYMSNHLTVLAHRNPLSESYNRVMKAKIEAGAA